MNKKKVILLLVIIALLFTLSGCTIPEENGKFVLIALENVEGVSNKLITTFSEMWNTEGFFSALFIYPLSQFINWLTPLSNVGIAILLVALTINGLLLILTFKQNISMQKIQLIQPEVDRIQRKYEGKTDQNSQMRMSQEIQRLYSKNKINPFGSLLVTFLQFPIIIAMYHAVQRAYSVAYGEFLGVSLERTPLEGIQNGQWIYLVFFLVMIGMQTLSVVMPQYLAKRKAKKEAELHHRPYRPTKNPMGSSMYIMVIAISFIAIMWPTAMTFYWIISSAINILKTLLVQHYTTTHSTEKGV